MVCAGRLIRLGTFKTNPVRMWSREPRSISLSSVQRKLPRTVARDAAETLSKS
jgi:hypothetical protein